MAKQAKTLRMIEIAKAILADHHPMTVRQVYYQLVSRQVIKNNRSQYQGVSNALVWARQEGIIPWDWMEDRLRRPRAVSMWDNLADFTQAAVRAYRLDVWKDQSEYVECWLEKDALSGIFDDVLNDYGVTLNVGRGFDGWDSIHNAAARYGTGSGVTVLYFGDFDPSGEDMIRSLRERLGFFGCEPEIIKCALLQDDISRFNIPPDFTKASDTRQAAFVAKYGDIAAELDALPVDILQSRLRNEVEQRLDLEALARVKNAEITDRERLTNALRDTE